MTDFSEYFDGKVEPYPYEETHDLRSGPDLHKALLPLLPFIGVWRGKGHGSYPSISDFHYAQEIRVSHDGRPFLFYESRSWIVDDAGEPVRPAAREVGFFRPVDDKPDEVELLLTHPTGIMELYMGRVNGVQMELVTDAVVRTPSAKEVTGGHRLYGIVDRNLAYVAEMAAEGYPLQSHLSAKLERVGG